MTPLMVSAGDLQTQMQETVDTDQAEHLLALVEAVVLTEYGADQPPVADRPLQLLRKAVLSAAAREYANPTGTSSKTIGPFTFRWEGDLTAQETRWVRLARGGNQGTTYSVDLA